jgi:hypothetical protein
MKKENKAWHPNNDFFNPEARSQPMCLGENDLTTIVMYPMVGGLANIEQP